MIKWESISEYSERTGTTKDTVRQMIKSGLLETELTEGGGKILIRVDKDTTEVEKKITTMEKKIDALCRHLGVSTLNI